MSLFDELEAEDRGKRRRISAVEGFLDELPKDVRADVWRWIKLRRSVAVLYRVLERRGIPVAEPTFRNWVRINRDRVQ